MRATATWDRGVRSDLTDGRDHSVVVDLPEDEGGHNAGTSALELNLLSMAGCITTIFALVARKRRLTVEHVEVELEGHRPRGAPTIASVDGTARIVSSSPPDEVAAALEITLRTCPVGVLYRNAGIPVTVRPIVVPPDPLHGATPPTPAHA